MDAEVEGTSATGGSLGLRAASSSQWFLIEPSRWWSFLPRSLTDKSYQLFDSAAGFLVRLYWTLL